MCLIAQYVALYQAFSNCNSSSRVSILKQCEAPSTVSTWKLFGRLLASSEPCNHKTFTDASSRSCECVTEHSLHPGMESTVYNWQYMEELPDVDVREKKDLLRQRY